MDLHDLKGDGAGRLVAALGMGYCAQQFGCGAAGHHLAEALDSDLGPGADAARAGERMGGSSDDVSPGRQARKMLCGLCTQGRERPGRGIEYKSEII